MTNFRYNIEKSKVRCEKVRKKLDEYVKKQEEVFMDIDSLKSCWIDVAAEAYINKVNEDKNIISELCNSLYQYQNNIEKYNEQLENVLCNEGYSSSDLDITFDSSKNNSAIGSLESICRCADYGIDDMNNCVVPYQYGYKYVIDEVFNDLYGIKDDSEYLASKIDDINRNIKRVTENSISDACSINQVSVDEKLLNVSYSIQPIIPNLKANIERNCITKVNIDSQNDIKIKENDMNKFAGADINDSNTTIDEKTDVNVEQIDNTDLIYNVVNSDSIKQGDVSKDEYTDTAVLDNTSTTTVDSIKQGDVSKDEYTDTAVLGNTATVDADFNVDMNIKSNEADDSNFNNSSKSVNIGDVSLEKITSTDVNDVKRQVSFNSGDLMSMNVGDTKATESRQVGDYNSSTLQNISTKFETNGSVKHTDVSVNNLQQSSRVSADDIISSRNI